MRVIAFSLLSAFFASNAFANSSFWNRITEVSFTTQSGLKVEAKLDTESKTFAYLRVTLGDGVVEIPKSCLLDLVQPRLESFEVLDEQAYEVFGHKRGAYTHIDFQLLLDHRLYKDYKAAVKPIYPVVSFEIENGAIVKRTLLWTNPETGDNEEREDTLELRPNQAMHPDALTRAGDCRR